MIPEVVEERPPVYRWQRIQRAFVVVVSLFVHFNFGWYCHRTLVYARLDSTALHSESHKMNVSRSIQPAIQASAFETVIFLSNLCYRQTSAISFVLQIELTKQLHVVSYTRLSGSVRELNLAQRYSSFAPIDTQFEV